MKMRILVMGAGAIGSAFGGFLRKAGHEVTLIGRAEHLFAILKDGLGITGIWGNHRIYGFSVSETADVLKGFYDAILFCVKTHDTETAARALRPLLRSETILISLQNGIGNTETIQAVTGHNTIMAGRVIFGSIIEKSGSVKISVYTEPVLVGFMEKQSQRTIKLARALCQKIDLAGIPCRYTDDIMPYLWSKLLYNCALNPLSAINRVSYGELPANPVWKTMMDSIIYEIYGVSVVKGVKLPYSNPREYLSIFYEKLVPDTAKHISSMLQDIQKGRRTEIDNLCGMVVKLAESAGLDVPVNRSLWKQVKNLQNNL